MQYYFAPLEGITDGIYRRLHHEHFGGVSKYFIPFISPTTQLSFTNRELKSVSRQLDAHFNCVPQVLTKDADSFVRTSMMLAELGYTEVNLNLGCPSGTVTGKGKGSAMLKEPEHLKAFFDEIFASCPISVSVKTRIGFEDASKWEELCAVFSSYPFSEVIIHPRTRREFYKGEVHRDAFERFYRAEPTKAVFNGDLFCPDDISGIAADFPESRAVMLGRGLVAAPYLAGGSFDRTKVKRFHDALFEAYMNDRPVNAVLGHMSEIMFYMSACFEGSKKCLKAMQKSRKAQDYMDAANAMFETCAPLEQPYYSPV